MQPRVAELLWMQLQQHHHHPGSEISALKVGLLDGSETRDRQQRVRQREIVY